MSVLWAYPLAETTMHPEVVTSNVENCLVKGSNVFRLVMIICVIFYVRHMLWFFRLLLDGTVRESYQLELDLLECRYWLPRLASDVAILPCEV